MKSAFSLLLLLALGSSYGISAEPTGDASVVKNLPGLVAFWTFGEEKGEPRISAETATRHALAEAVNKIARADGGPYSGYSAALDGSGYLHVPYADLKDLDIHGKQAQVSMFAVIRVDEMKHGITVAGIWSEGKGAKDDSGTRQYSLLLNMPAYGGPKRLVPHISAEGGVTRRADGSAFPWCCDYAVNVSEIPVGKWVTIGMTYDSKYLRAYYNGVMEERAIHEDPANDRRNDPYFLKEGPNGGPRGMNPYYHGKGIFKYDPALHAQTKPDGGADFTVGACFAVGKRIGNPLKGRIGGLAIYNRALTDEEMMQLHRSANHEKLPNLEKGSAE